MNYFSKFNVQEEKLEDLLAENRLVYTFDTNDYPITLTVQPNVTPDAQMAMYETANDGVSSQDAKLVFQFFVGEIGVRVYGRLIISDDLMNKIKNHGKQMMNLWLQSDYAARMYRKKLIYHVEEPVDQEEEPGDQEPADFSAFYDEQEDSE